MVVVVAMSRVVNTVVRRCSDGDDDRLPVQIEEPYVGSGDKCGGFIKWRKCKDSYRIFGGCGGRKGCLKNACQLCAAALLCLIPLWSWQFKIQLCSLETFGIY